MTTETGAAGSGSSIASPSRTTMATQRVNVTTAAKLTGRSEKTIRAWLAERPCPLSIEWGKWRGGRRVEVEGERGKRETVVQKGRTRLLDVDELRSLHEARGGVAWHDQYLPPPDVHALLARVRELEARVAALEGARTVVRRVAAEDSPPPFVWPAGPRPSAPPRAPRAPRAPARVNDNPLPERWVPLTTMARAHGLDDRTLRRLADHRALMPDGQTPLAYEQAPVGRPWNPGRYAIKTAVTPEQHVLFCEYAHTHRLSGFRPSCGPACPYESSPQTTPAADEETIVPATIGAAHLT